MAQLIPIGNSRGIRIPKLFIEQAQLDDKELALKLVPEGLLIQPINKPRAGWAEQFNQIEAQALTSEDKDWLEADMVKDNSTDEWQW